MAAAVTGLRTKARVFEPEAFDPGQVVEFGGKRGVVWSLGYEVGRKTDSRWVVVEDGAVELLVLSKAGSELSAAKWGERYVPVNATPFTVSEFFESEQMEMAA